MFYLCLSLYLILYLMNQNRHNLLLNAPPTKRFATAAISRPMLRICLAIAAAGILLAIYFRPIAAPKGPPYVHGPCYAPPGGKPALIPGVPYHYQAPPDRQAAILAGFPQLLPGMSRQQVRAIMGDPDIDQGNARPLVFSAYNEYVGISWRYILRSAEPDGTNTNDSLFEIYFTTDDHIRVVQNSLHDPPH